HRPLDIREPVQLLGETVADRVPTLEDALGHELDGVLGVQIHHGLEIALVVALDVVVQELAVGAHRLLLSRASRTGSGGATAHTCLGMCPAYTRRVILCPKSDTGAN